MLILQWYSKKYVQSGSLWFFFKVHFFIITSPSRFQTSIYAISPSQQMITPSKAKPKGHGCFSKTSIHRQIKDMQPNQLTCTPFATEYYTYICDISTCSILYIPHFISMHTYVVLCIFIYIFSEIVIPWK